MYIILLKLSCAAMSGLILGIERETKQKPLGLKTFVVISVASYLLTIISIQLVLNTYNENTIFIRSDPMRLASQIVSGIGFLGAGVILRRNNNVISGLTTAALVWAASGLGISIGAGYYYEAGVGLLIIVISIRFLPYLIRKYGPSLLRIHEVKIKILINPSINTKQIVDVVRESVVDIKDTKLKGKASGHNIELLCNIKEDINSVDEYVNFYDKISRVAGVERVEIERR